jgi:formylglycine-generating enzyme required for sulfatase activity
MCSKCHKRVAVVFVTKLENGNKVNEGLCIKCAKDLGVPIDNMLGNVMEYCEDWYAENAYSSIQDGDLDPKGPKKGKEHVVRGGHYNSDAAMLRSSARSHTEHDDWLRTDPQNPKSIWWYSDVKGIGFRVVCDVPEMINKI